MPALLNTVDPDGLLEYSVVYTDRALNHMSQAFQGVMRDISQSLRQAYGASAVAVVPGGGTFAMEAVARQFAGGRRCLVLRNGWFSFRWSQILDMGGIAAGTDVLKARRSEAGVGEGKAAPFAPAPIDEVVAAILAQRPEVVFAPHVETASGIWLPDDYLRAVAAAVRQVDGLFVLDCIASGALWVDMRTMGIDVLISAPQKGWSGPSCAGLVMLGERALARIADTASSSFACDLKKWLQIMEAYEKGGHAYHATLPTDALRQVRNAMRETESHGLELARTQQWELGRRVRALLVERGFASVAAAGFEAPGVVVSHTTDPEIQSAKKFLGLGLQTAAGVPLQCDEPADFRTFRIGLFGLDKLANVERTVATLRHALDRLV
ncbi:MAG: aminotransferase class V-fold PLP-dependent enzyme [Sulfuritalea sp.]|nr:aminotransferase class V-fold PLP-dependent enzyme [Sulfuritalea sp.]